MGAERAVLIAEVRALHEPDGICFCTSCEDTEWPCPTAEIVYEPDEIKTIRDAASVASEARARATTILWKNRLAEIGIGSRDE